MPDDPNPNATPAPGPSQPEPRRPRMNVMVRDEHARITYVNSIGVHKTDDEVVIDVAAHLPAGLANSPMGSQGDPSQPPDQQSYLHVESRLVMNYTTAKRFAISLGKLIRRHEELFGEIRIDAPSQTPAGHKG